jgi:hypothetical protein
MRSGQLFSSTLASKTPIIEITKGNINTIAILHLKKGTILDLVRYILNTKLVKHKTAKKTVKLKRFNPIKGLNQRRDKPVNPIAPEITINILRIFLTNSVYVSAKIINPF